MTNPSPQQNPSALRLRLLAVVGILTATGALLLAVMLRRRPPPAAEELVSTIAPEVIPEVRPPAPVVSGPPAQISPLRWLGFLLVVGVVGAGWVALQNSAPDVASALFVGFLVISAVFIVRYYRLTFQSLISPLFEVPRALIYFYRPPGLPAEPKSPPAKDIQSSFISVIVSLAMLFGLIVVLLFLPYAPVVSISVVVLLVGLSVIAFRQRMDIFILIRLLYRTFRAALPLETVEIAVVSRRRLAAELTLILVVVLFLTNQFYTTSPDFQLTGHEAEWLTASVYTAHDGLQREGRIPLWQPYLESGEPLLENPFSFILNPFSGIPSLVLGAQTGIKISIVLTALLAGVGGWFLARMLGLSTLGRLLLAMLLLGKGNMVAMIDTGYFQLGVSQAYFPWVIGATLAILRFPRQRWPVVLMAVSITLLYFAGNLWYIVPTIISAALLAFIYIIRAKQRRIDWLAVRRFLLTAVLVGGLSAVTLIPLLVNFDRIGKHPPENGAGWVIPLWDNAIPLYTTSDPFFQINIFSPEIQSYQTSSLYEYKQFYYSFTVPLWYLVLILVVMPLYRPSSSKTRRLWLMGVLLLILATSWGAGGQPLFLWLYAHVPFMSQWRFVGRAFAIGAFWVAVLVALRADQLWSHINTTDWGKLGMRPRLAHVFPLVMSVILVIGSAAASREVNLGWNEPMVAPINPDMDWCITWLRHTYPNRPLAVWQGSYVNITTYLTNHVRDWNVQADFEMSPLTSTVGSPILDLTASLPEFGIAENPGEIQYFNEHQYTLIQDSSPSIQDSPCLEHLFAAMPYSYTIPLAYIQNFTPLSENITRRDFPAGIIMPVETFVRNDDNIEVVLNGSRNDSTILTVQERAYPGWQVEVNGQPAKLESVGGQLGVVLPYSDVPLTIYFVYRPPLLMLGGMITLLTAAFCIAYLLLPFRRKKA